jgi:hypothetical protein
MKRHYFISKNLDDLALIAAGEGHATPGWVIGAQQKWSRFMELAP